MKIFIKNMVSVRCKVLVMDELKKLGLMFTDLQLGSVTLLKNLTIKEHERLGRRLLQSGLELHDDKKGLLVEKIKHLLLASLETPDIYLKKKISVYLAETLKYEYNYLSNLFTEVEGMSIQKFIMVHKVEMVKELLSHGDLNLTEIAYKLNYSSGAHMSNQFKKVTGLSPSLFKITKK